MNFLKGIFKSRKYVLCLGTMATIVCNEIFKLGLSEEVISNLVNTFGVWVLGQGGVDVALALKGQYGKKDEKKKKAA